MASDGSFQARVPAGVPFRLQALDGSRMAVGAMHDRWFYTLGGQVLTQGVPVELYETTLRARKEGLLPQR